MPSSICSVRYRVRPRHDDSVGRQQVRPLPVEVLVRDHVGIRSPFCSIQSSRQRSALRWAGEPSPLANHDSLKSGRKFRRGLRREA